jgi:hypothetical protein
MINIISFLLMGFPGLLFAWFFLVTKIAIKNTIDC